MDKTTLARLLVELLRNKPPMRVHRMVELLKLSGTKDITVQQLNTILYGNTGASFTRNESYEWSLAPTPAATTPSVSRPIPEPVPQAVHPRAIPLRAVQRLRSGLPPQEGIQDVTVGNHHDIITNVLRAHRRQDRWMLVIGDYGDGKTHTLRLFEHQARDEGYATCHLSADAAASALNHPQRFLPLLLATLDVPGRMVTGYQDFLHQSLASDDTVRRALTLVTQRLSDLTILRRELEEQLQLLQRIPPDTPERVVAAQSVVRLLHGDSLASRFADPPARNQAYQLLGIAQDLVVASGARGLAFIIDEAESIFTKLPQRLSRYGAYRVLASLCTSDDLPHCCAAIAVTPDAYRELERIDIVRASYGCLPAEPVRNWAAAIARHTVPSLTCTPLTNDDVRALLDRVAGVYRRAYATLPWHDGLQSHWQAFRQDVTRKAVPVRIGVRRAVDFLDYYRCTHGVEAAGQ